MDPDQLLQIALRVLGSYVDYRSPAPSDVQVLREAVTGPESRWDADILAAFIIERQLAKHKSHGAA